MSSALHRSGLVALALIALSALIAPFAGAQAFTIDVSPHNGEHVNVAAGGTSLAYATPAYVSADVPRSVGFVYSSALARPQALVQVDVEDVTGTPPDAYSVQLWHGQTQLALSSGGTEVFYAGGPGRTRLTAQADVSSLVTGAYPVMVQVRKWRAGQVYATATATVRVLVQNEGSSPYGAGWILSGISRIRVQNDGSVLLTEGDGAALLYARTPQCTSSQCAFRSPAGDFSRLEYGPTPYGPGYARHHPGDPQRVDYFAADGLLFRLHARNEVTAIGRSAAGHVTTITDPAGKALTLAYAPGSQFGLQGTVVTVHDPGGRRTLLSVTPGGDLAWIQDPTGVATLRMGYDAAHRLSWWSDRAGNTRNEAYDRYGWHASTTAPPVPVEGEGTVRPVVARRSLAMALQPAAGTGTTYATRGARRVPDDARVSWTDPRGKTSEARLDRFGSAVWTRDPLGRVEVAARDAHSRVVRSVSVAGDTVDYAHRPTGPEVDSIMDRRTGKVVRMGYTADHRLLWSTGGDRTIANEYEEVTAADGTPTGELGPLVFSRVGAEAHFYDHHGGSRVGGRPRAVYGPGGDEQFHDDPVWRNTDVATRSDGTTMRFRFDALGRAETSWNTLGDSTRTEFDLLNRPLRVVSGSGLQGAAYAPGTGTEVSYAYDDLGALRTVTDARGQVYETVRNALGWVVERKDPGGRVERFSHDRAGNVVAHTNRRGQTVRFGYDDLGRVAWRDADGRRTTYGYGIGGQTLVASNAESTDSVGVVRQGAAGWTHHQVTRRVGQRHELKSTYDRTGARTALETVGSPAAYHAGFQYERADESYRLRWLSGPGGYTELRADTARNLGLRILPGGDTVLVSGGRVRYSNPAVDSALGILVSRDTVDRVVRRTSAPLDSMRVFRFDPMGRIAMRIDSVVRMVPGQVERCVDDYELGYFCWMDSGEVPAMVAKDSTAYLWDAVGNPHQMFVPMDAGNRISSYRGYAFEYDLDGNVTRKYLASNASTFDQRLWWSSLGELDSVRTLRAGVPSTVRFGYDGWGRRVRKTTAAGTTRYVYDGDHVVLELNGSGGVVAEYTYNPGVDNPHSVRRGGKTYYYLTDGPGNVTGLVELPGGTLTNEYRYGPFGEAETVREGVPNPFRFTGREYDAETGLYFFRARYYDPEIGRFLSEDPAGLAGGINVYAYAGDPVNLRDPSGMTPDCLLGIRLPSGLCLYALDEGIVANGANSGRSWFQEALDRAHSLLFGGSAWGGFTDPSEEAYYYQRVREAEVDSHREQRKLEAVRSLREGADLGVGLAPGLSTAHDVSVLVSGHNVITGQDVGFGGRVVAGLGAVVPGVSGGMIRGAGKLLPKTIVIGENMQRVRGAARLLSAKTFEVPFLKEWDDDIGMFLNTSWLQEMVDEGYWVVDIGIDKGRSLRSAFYGMEQRVTRELGARRIPVWWPSTR